MHTCGYIVGGPIRL